MDNVGTATKHFLGLPGAFSFWEFAGIAFILFVIVRHWGRFANSLS